MIGRLRHILFLLPAVLLLTGCESSTEPEKPDWTGLLTDEELRTERDPAAPQEDADWTEWIKQNNIPIRSLEAENFLDLRSLVPYFNGKRIVQLGESGHGVQEFNKVKVRFIKFLHQELGFDVIAFESSMFECFYTNEHLSGLSASDAIRNSIFGVWHTHELVPLFEYLKDQQSDSRPLALAGFDIQVSSADGVSHRPDFLWETLAVFNPDYADRIREIDLQFLEDMRDLYLIDQRSNYYISKYAAVADSIDEHMAELIAQFAEQPKIPLIARQTAKSMIEYVAQLGAYYRGDTAVSQEIRDAGMALNLEYLLEEVYPGSKIIVWAHNAHISHNYKSTSGGTFNSMGTWIAEAHRPELYTVGLYMYRGKAAYNNRQVYAIQPAWSGSIESIMYRTRRKFCFVDMLGRTKHKGNSWMFEEILAKEWGVWDVTLVPRDQYDALLFIDTVNPPSYLPAGDTDSWPLIEIPPASLLRGSHLNVSR